MKGKGMFILAICLLLSIGICGCIDKEKTIVAPLNTLALYFGGDYETIDESYGTDGGFSWMFNEIWVSEFYSVHYEKNIPSFVSILQILAKFNSSDDANEAIEQLGSNSPEVEKVLIGAIGDEGWMDKQIIEGAPFYTVIFRVANVIAMIYIGGITVIENAVIGLAYDLEDNLQSAIIMEQK